MTGTAPPDEDSRARELLAAERKAVTLFDETARRGLIVPGETERVVSDRIRDLGAELFGTDRHWHKRVVRSGENTLAPYAANPPDRVIGADPVKARLRDDLPRIWEAGRAHFEAHPQISGAELYAHVVGLAEAAGWGFGGPHSGHLVGEFPHEFVDGERIESYIAPGSDHPMRRLDPSERRCHWILEVHLVDRERRIGGFFEQLLTLRP